MPSKKCKHGRELFYCKDCGGNGICTHGRRKFQCKDCGYQRKSYKCIHQKDKYGCNECGTTRKKCPHDKLKAKCKECKGGSICIHGRHKYSCKECGGNGICEHGRVRSICIECGNVRKRPKCIHKRDKYHCKICSPSTHLSHAVRTAVNKALGAKKSERSIQYLGCSIEHYKTHLESQFKDDMTWDNHGELWHIDHITPLMYEQKCIDCIKVRLHYTNTQPMYAFDNMSKGNRRIE
jgi:hypothetical protein